jgi:hypothetical protein
MSTTLLASVQTGTGMPGQTAPRAAVVDPGLGHGHPPALFTLVGDHGVDDDGAQDGRRRDDLDVDVDETLLAPVRPARAGVGRDVAVPVECLAAVRHPTEARVQQLPQRRGVPSCQRFRARQCCGEDLVALVHGSTLAPEPGRGCHE